MASRQHKERMSTYIGDKRRTETLTAHFERLDRQEPIHVNDVKLQLHGHFEFLAIFTLDSDQMGHSCGQIAIPSTAIPFYQLLSAHLSSKAPMKDERHRPKRDPLLGPWLIFRCMKPCIQSTIFRTVPSNLGAPFFCQTMPNVKYLLS
jgi:hypothetical protein